MTMNKLIIADELDSAQITITRLQDENRRLQRIIATIYEPEALTMNAYQEQAHVTSLNTQIAESGLVYPVLGLVNEAGELAGKVKKIYRDKGGLVTVEDGLALCTELCDVLWYVAEIATQLDVDLADIADLNLRKLADRANRGVIGGSGDAR